MMFGKIKELRKKLYRKSVIRAGKKIRKEVSFKKLLLIVFAVILLITGPVSFVAGKMEYDRLFEEVNPSYTAYLSKAATALADKESFLPDGDKYLDLSHSDGEDQWLMQFGGIRLTISAVCSDNGSWMLFNADTGEVIFESGHESYVLRVYYRVSESKSRALFYTLNPSQNMLVSAVRKRGDGNSLTMAPYFVSGYLKGTEVVIEKYKESRDGEVKTADISGIDLTGYTHVETVPDSKEEKWNKKLIEKARFGTDGNYEFAVMGFWDATSNNNSEAAEVLEKAVKSGTQDVWEQTEQIDFYSRRYTDGYYETSSLGTCYGAAWTWVQSLDKKLLLERVIGYALLWLFGSFVLAWIIAAVDYRKRKISHEIYSYRVALTDTLAHDLKTPLMSISGYAENLEADTVPEKREKYIHEIRTQVEYMNDMINSILALSKAEKSISGNDEVDLPALALRVTEIISKQRTGEGNAMPEFKISGMGTVRGDAKSLETIMRNLIENAVKYGTPGSVINIGISEKSLTVDNAIEKETETAISDLFKPFVKEDSSRSGRNGHGLGLAIVKNICDSCGYSINAECRNGRFIVRVDF